MLIPVRKIEGGEKVRFPLPAATDVEVNLVNAYRRYALEWSVDEEDDSQIVARVDGTRLPLGTYALEVKGRMLGMAWRSNEYAQLRIVDSNADGDTELDATDEGEGSVMMDTAIVVLPPAKELTALIDGAREATAAATAATDGAKEAAASAVTATQEASAASDAAHAAASNADAATQRAEAAAQRAASIAVGVDAATGETVIEGS